MGEVVSLNPVKDLEHFFTFMYSDQKGFVYVATKDFNTGDFQQYFFQWPTEREALVKHVVEQAANREVYYGPALYNSRNADKESVLGSYFVWCEFDGNAPKHIDNVPSPSLIIRSSLEKNQHWYWKLDHFETDKKILEDIMSRIVYSANADFAWAANKILRPPNTVHHESKKLTCITRFDPRPLGLESFQSLPEVPIKVIDVSDINHIPQPLKVIAKYPFEEHLEFFMDETKQVKKGNRSSALTKLAHICIELGMTNAEILGMLFHADERWGKFSKRDDRKYQLIKIINYCRSKHATEEIKLEGTLKVYNFTEFIKNKIQVDWIIKDLIPEKGLVVIFGPPRVGKSQLSLRFAEKLAKGEQFLKWPTERPRRVIFLSLEMPHNHLWLVLNNMKIVHHDLLTENFLISPPGYSIKLLSKEGQKALEYIIEKYKPEGIIIDSYGVALMDDISSEKIVFEAVQYLKFVLMEHFGVFVWFIHHPRKSQVGNKQPDKLDDMYGSQFLGSQSDTIISVRTVAGGEICVENIKNRFGEQFSKFNIRRTPNLDFQIVQTTYRTIDTSGTSIFGGLGDTI